MSPTIKLVAPAKPTKIPASSNDLQFNFCKNPTCDNFGVKPPVTATTGTKKTYTIYAGNNHSPLLKCKLCGEQPPLKSNKGIIDEIERISSYLNITGMKSFVSCPDEECDNHTVPYGTKKAYRSFGQAASGAKRIQCAICDTTFTIPKPTQRQRKTHYNIDIFKLLMNKVPLSRIVSIFGISWEVLYNRIDFIHTQCLAFVANRENKLRDMSIDRLYLSIDKQEYEINWTDRKDKRSIVLAAMASADNATGYVFGIHPNFDYSLDKVAIEADALRINDASLPDPLKKYARLWLEADYVRARQIAKAKSAKAKAKSMTSSKLNDDIADAYDEAQLRDDIEVFDEKTEEEKLPSYGMQVKAEYTMIAHFYFLKNMMGHVGSWRFFLDQESGIRSACLGAFKEEIVEHRAEAFYVRIEKHMMVGEKRRLKEVAKRRFDQTWKTITEPNYEKVKLEMLKDTIRSVTQFGHYKDRWVRLVTLDCLYR
jgi:LSD1 subclass zinc finger protein